ncbi:MAG: CZB domain-containing protein [Magnetococcales bacterium]|nr:CZB domain-containing protein [Magnetococcales bacterium]
MGTRLEISVARTLHLYWEAELEKALITPGHRLELPNHEDCELGLWLHNTGLRKYRSIPGFTGLLDTHRKFHVAAGEVAATLADPDRARVVMEDVRELSREIIFRLTRLELDSLARQRETGQSASHPLRPLINWLFDGHRPESTPRNDSVLEVSRARLMHLQWAQGVADLFRRWGKPPLPESAEICSLGLWLHSVGARRCVGMAEMQALDVAHKEFHLKAEQAVRAFHNRRMGEAEAAYDRMHRKSREVVYLLSVLEYRLLDADAILRIDHFLE